MDWSLTLTPLIAILVLLLTLWFFLSPQISHPSQILPLLKLWVAHKRLRLPPNTSADWAWTYAKLKETSRSFYFVIMSAPKNFRESITIFYLAARALDTIEDDMTPSIGDKQRELRQFHEHLSNPNYSLKGFGEKPHEIEMLEHYGKIATGYNTLSPPVQATITRIIHEMGSGMAQYLSKEVITLPDLDEYCHYVAGIVGIGIVQIGIDIGFQQEFPGISPTAREALNNNGGLFLQKINIIRDFQEDIRITPRPRIFWPREIWSKYTDRLEDFLEPSRLRDAISCSNELITNAMLSLPGVLEGLGYLDEAMFKPISAPFVMAIATYELCYDNEELFKKTLKIKRGQAASIFGRCDSFHNVLDMFTHYMRRLRRKAVAVGDSNSRILVGLLDQGLKIGAELKSR